MRATFITGSLAGSLTGAAPRIECFPARSRRRKGAALVIFPGGGYAALSDYEGAGYARRFSREGFACFVVSYRLGSQGHRHPAMLEDALAAVSTVRSRCSEFGVNPDRIGVMGSSAGGHLAAHALTSFDRYPGPVSTRPEFGHAGSREMLLGSDPPAGLVDEVSCELHVTSRTAPCFLWHTREDTTVPYQNSMLFAAALQACGVPFELHVFDRGEHGLGKDQAHPWAAVCSHWLADLFRAGG
ncbi:MAG: alpha/beta hydrolase [Spirochaetes bacterium]|nr:alpha/beta hydrolase [Spirochaetota bacterium]